MFIAFSKIKSAKYYEWLYAANRRLSFQTHQGTQNAASLEEANSQKYNLVVSSFSDSVFCSFCGRFQHFSNDTTHN